MADDAPTQDHSEETQPSEAPPEALTAPEEDVVADPFAVGEPFSDVAAEEPESRLILETASGRKTKSEEFGYGDDEFAPWTLGATM